MDTKLRGYSIGELSTHTGVHIETIRYYERIGILPKPDRLANGYRQFNHEQLKRLNFIRKSRNLGFNLKEVERLLSMVDNDHLSCGDIHDTAIEHLKSVNEKMKQLRLIKSVLKNMADKCSQGDVPDCPIIDALFE